MQHTHLLQFKGGIPCFSAPPLKKQYTVNFFMASILLIVAIRGAFMDMLCSLQLLLCLLSWWEPPQDTHKWTNLQSSLCKVPTAASTSKLSLCSCTSCDARGRGVRAEGFLWLSTNWDQPTFIYLRLRTCFGFSDHDSTRAVWIFLIERQSTSSSKLGVCKEHNKLIIQNN